jgi:hypothetical protein
LRLVGKLLARFALILIGILLSLTVLEFGIRIMGMAPPAEAQPALWAPHPYMGWFHVPNRGGLSYSDFGEYQAEVHINARGLRDREIGYDNTEGAYRILVLGDSFAEALQVSLDDTFIKQMEANLETDDTHVEVINGGVGGWGTDQEAIFYMVEGFRYSPDLVLLCFFTNNDTLNNYQPLETARTHGEVNKPFFHIEDGQLVPPEFPFEAPPADNTDTPSAPLLGAANWLQKHSAFYRLTAPYLREMPPVLNALGPTGILGGMATFMAEDPILSPSYFVYSTQPSPEWDAAWELTQAIISGLKQEVEADGSQLAVVIIGAPEQVYPERWQAILRRTPALQDQGWDLETPNRRLASFLDSAGIPYLDLLPLFREKANKPDTPAFHFRHDGHWTPAGHELAAEAITSFVQELRETSSNSAQP